MNLHQNIPDRTFRIVIRVAIFVFTVIVIIMYARASHAQQRAHVSVDIDLRALIGRLEPRKAPNVTCGISTVGYRFIGTPGRKLRYAGDTYEIEEDGDVELIADRRRQTYAVDGRSLPLEVWPTNQFGFREVPVK